MRSPRVSSKNDPQVPTALSPAFPSLPHFSPRPPAQFLWDHLLKHPAGGCFWRNPNHDNPSFVDCPEAHVRLSLNNFSVNDHETSGVVLESGDTVMELVPHTGKQQALNQGYLVSSF